MAICRRASSPASLRLERDAQVRARGETVDRCGDLADLVHRIRRAGVRAGLLRRMGSGTVLNIRRVAEIAPEKSGKYRYVVSLAPR